MLLLVKLSLIFLSTAINNSEIHKESDTASLKLLKNIAEKYKKYNNIEIGFTYKQFSLENRRTESITGKLIMDKMHTNYIIETDNLEILVGEDKIYTMEKGKDEIFISKVEENLKALNPYRFLQGNFSTAHYKVVTDFTTKHSEQEKIINIFSTESSFPFYKILICIDKTSMSIKKIKFNDKEGFIYEYTVLKERFNVPLPSKKFIFDVKQHEDKEIIDYTMTD